MNRQFGGVGRLHVITDTRVQSRHGHARLAVLAAAGGADVVQLRHKGTLAKHTWLALAQQVMRALAATPARLVINDRVDVAAAVGAGVHVGHGDPSPQLARRRLGSRALLGATAHSLQEAQALARGPIDYLGVGPVYATRSKDLDVAPLGLDGLAQIAGSVHRPVIAIGGITVDRVAEVFAAGAAGIAVLSAVVCAGDPVGVTKALQRAIAAAQVNTAWAEGA